MSDPVSAEYADELMAEIERLRARVEELEGRIIRLAIPLDSDIDPETTYIFTTEQIDEAVQYGRELMYQKSDSVGSFVLAALKKLGIVRCEGCARLGRSPVSIDDDGREWRCGGCDGHGWKVTND